MAIVQDQMFTSLWIKLGSDAFITNLHSVRQCMITMINLKKHLTTYEHYKLCTLYRGNKTVKYGIFAKSRSNYICAVAMPTQSINLLSRRRFTTYQDTQRLHNIDIAG